MARRGWIAVAGIAVLVASIVGIRVLLAGHSKAGTRAAASAPAKVSAGLAASLPLESLVEAMVFSPDGRMLAVRLDSGAVQLRKADNGALLRSLGSTARSSDAPTAPLAFSPDGRTVAIDGGSRSHDTTTVELVGVATGKVTASVRIGASQVHSVAFSPDGKTLAIAAGTRLVLWDLATHATIDVGTHQTAYEGDSTYVGYSADGKTLAVVSNEGLVKLWDVAATGFTKSTTVSSAQGSEPADIAAASISPDGGTVAVSGDLSGYDATGTRYDDPETWLWHPATGKTVPLQATVPQRGLDNGISAQALSPDGRLLATGDYMGTIGVWDVASRRLVATEHAPSAISPLRAVAFAPDGTSLATAQSTSTGQGGTSTLQLWSLGPTAAHARPTAPGTAPAALRPGVYKVGRVMAIVGSWVITLDSVQVAESGHTTFIVTTKNTSTVDGQLPCAGPQGPSGASITLAGGQVTNGSAAYCPGHPGVPSIAVSSQGVLRSYAVFPDSRGLARPFAFDWSGPSGLSGGLSGIALGSR